MVAGISNFVVLSKTLFADVFYSDDPVSDTDQPKYVDQSAVGYYGRLVDLAHGGRRHGHVAKASRQLIYTDYHSPKISCAKPFSFPVGTQDILDSVYATDCIDGDISNKVEITGDSVFFLNIAGEYEIWLQVTNSCGDMVTVPVTLEMVDYRQQTERTKRAEAEKQMERTNLTEKATEETGQKETEGAENGTKAG